MHSRFKFVYNFWYVVTTGNNRHHSYLLWIYADIPLVYNVYYECKNKRGRQNLKIVIITFSETNIEISLLDFNSESYSDVKIVDSLVCNTLTTRSLSRRYTPPPKLIAANCVSMRMANWRQLASSREAWEKGFSSEYSSQIFLHPGIPFLKPLEFIFVRVFCV